MIWCFLVTLPLTPCQAPFCLLVSSSHSVLFCDPLSLTRAICGTNKHGANQWSLVAPTGPTSEEIPPPLKSSAAHSLAERDRSPWVPLWFMTGFSRSSLLQGPLQAATTAVSLWLPEGSSLVVFFLSFSSFDHGITHLSSFTYLTLFHFQLSIFQ